MPPKITLEEAQQRLAGATEDEPQGFMAKALNILGMNKAVNSATQMPTPGIIGHPAPDLNAAQKAVPGRSGGNPYDEEDPEGEPADPIQERGSEAEAASNIARARAAAAAPGNVVQHGEIEKSKRKAKRNDPGDDDDDDGDGDGDGDDDAEKSRRKFVKKSNAQNIQVPPQMISAEKLYKAMAAADGDGALSNAFEASTALERLTDTMVKAYADQDVRISDLAERVETLLTNQDNMAKAFGEMIKGLEPLNKAGMVDRSGRPEGEVRAIFPGAAVQRAGAVSDATSEIAPEGMTKAHMVDGLLKAHNNGKLSEDAVPKFMAMLDTRGIDPVWDALSPEARAIIVAK